MRKLLFLNSAQRFADFALLLLRVFVGVFLIWGTWKRVTNAGDMHQFSEFLGHYRLPQAEILAPVFAYLQLAIGVGFILGLFTRWAGIFCVVIFGIVIAMIDRASGMVGIFHSGFMAVAGLYLATHGAGRFSIDAALGANDLKRAGGGVRLK